MKSKRVLALIMGAIIASGGISQMAVQVYADDEESSSISESEEESSSASWSQMEKEFEWIDGELSDSSNSVEEGLDAEVLTKLSSESKRVNELVRDGILTKVELDELYVSKSNLVFKSISDNEAELVCYDVNDKFDRIVTVPQNVSIGGKNYTVTSIGDSAFKNNNLLENVVLPASITKIGKEAFYECKRLKLEALPEGLTEIGEYAFNWCYHLTLKELPAGLTKIGKGAFSHCEKLELEALPEGLTVIHSGTFWCCHALKLTKLPANIRGIGSKAFLGCTNLKLTELPAGLTKIYSKTFSDCTNLELTSLPEGLTEIGESAFAGCKKLNLTELPTGLTKIGNSAFKDAGIKEITIPASVTELNFEAFDTKTLNIIRVGIGSKLAIGNVRSACGTRKNRVVIMMPQLVQLPVGVTRKTIISPDQLVNVQGAEYTCPICWSEIINKESREPVEVVEFPCAKENHHYFHSRCFDEQYATTITIWQKAIRSGLAKRETNYKFPCPGCRQGYDMPGSFKV